MTAIIKSRFLEITTHILLWAVFFVFLIFFSPSPFREAVDWNFILKSSGQFLFFFLLIFYVNYFILIERLIFQKKVVIFVLINLVLIALCSLLNSIFRVDFPVPHHDSPFGHFMKEQMARPNRLMIVIKMSSPFVLPVVMSVAIKITQHWFKTETAKKEAENKNLESELLHLRYQVQPHFFFNSLNTIYSLIENSPKKAQEGVHSLSKLMRYLLYETGNSNVELSQEISFLIKYIELMQLRLTDKTKVTYDFPKAQITRSVPPLLFVPLLENAYKHGISATRQSFIFFEMKILGNKIYFLTENSNFPKTDLDKSGSGIGLDNLKKRLNLLYKDHHTFTTEVVDDVFRTRLVIEID